MTKDIRTRHAGMFGDEQHDGQDKGGQMRLFDSIGTSLCIDDTTDTRESEFEKAQRRADEAMTFFTVYPMAWPVARRYARNCARDGRRIETHALVAEIKAAGGNAVQFNNNHAPLTLRLLARDSAVIANNVEFRGSMYDLLDLDKYLSMIRNQQRSER